MRPSWHAKMRCSPLKQDGFRAVYVCFSAEKVEILAVPSVFALFLFYTLALLTPCVLKGLVLTEDK